MSLLTEFVSALAPAKRADLCNIPLRGKQAAILRAIVHDPHNPKHLEAEARKLSISTSHLYAIQSTLLERCYEFVVPAGGFELLTFLRVRGLDAHFRHELHAFEKRIHASTLTKAEQHDFYQRLLYLLISTTTGKFERKYFSAVVAMFHRTIVHPHPDDTIHVRILEALGDTIELLSHPTRDRLEGRASKLLRRLIELRDELGSSDLHFARYNLAYAFVLHYVALEPDPRELGVYQKQLLEEIRYLPETIQSVERPKLALREAGAAFTRREFDEALRLYQEQYDLHGIDLYRLYAYHLDRFIRVALYKRKYTQAEQLIHEGLTPIELSTKSAVGTVGLLHETILHLLQGDAASARESLRRAIRRNSGAIHAFSIDVQLRLLEVLIEMTLGADRDYVQTLITRSIKHLSRKGLTLKTGEAEVTMLYALKDILDGVHDSAFVTAFFEDGSPSQPVYVILLEDIIKAKARRGRRASVRT